jgi:hypothetical protein
MRPATPLKRSPGLRWRARGLGLLAAFVFLLLLVPAAGAQAAPLTGETFTDGNFTLTRSGPCDTSQPITFSFTADGPASGPYPGTFTESGRVTLGPEITDPQSGPLRPITGFDASFTISSGTNTITGAKTLRGSYPTGPVDLGPGFGVAPQMDIGQCEDANVAVGTIRTDSFQSLVSYQANIQSGSSTSCDKGEGFVIGSLQDFSSGQTSGNFDEAFTSTGACAPTTTQHCNKDGWKAYGVFKNQGDCVSYVATHGKNEPGQNIPG